MVGFKKTISISHAPNLLWENVLTACCYVFFPWRWHAWFRGEFIEKIEKAFSQYHKGYSAISFDSGRSAFFSILQAAGIESGDEVILQPLTCVVLPNDIIWRGAVPVYVDVDDTYNIDASKIEEKITEKTKAILVQHSFGVPADMDAITRIARQHNLLLIEDCAHSLGARYNDLPVGTIGDVAFFSMGRDKVISSVSGGMVISTNTELVDKIRAIQTAAQPLPTFRVFQFLFHIIAFSVILPLYNRLAVGKILLMLLQRIGFLNKAYTEKERLHQKPDFIPAPLPNALAHIALEQFSHLEEFNAHRRIIARLYEQRLGGIGIHRSRMNAQSIYLRYVIRVSDPQQIIALASRAGVILGDWYRTPIVPTADVTAVGYTIGSCPMAERLAGHMLNLPTHHLVSEADAERIALLIL